MASPENGEAKHDGPRPIRRRATDGSDDLEIEVRRSDHIGLPGCVELDPRRLWLN